ncbi:MAG: hypothetical protein JNN04_12135 [Cyclobacteriaceae bacterium]|nr:hypothetical protein [Cyclobacteriaceae bacterium]
MKRLIYLILAGIVMLGPVSCKKDDPAPAGPTLPTAPEAKAEHNTKSGGIYKGTFANSSSSGTVKIVLQDGKTEAVVTYNGTTRTLTTTDLSSWVSGDAITGATFTSTDWQLLFMADADGSSFAFGLNLAGTVDFEGVIMKELSTAQVRVYEGTYAGAASGKWNFFTIANQLQGVYTGSSSGYFEGVITGSNIAITGSGSSVTAVGTFTGEASACSGTWESSGDTGTWTGSRKL